MYVNGLGFRAQKAKLSSTARCAIVAEHMFHVSQSETSDFEKVAQADWETLRFRNAFSAFARQNRGDCLKGFLEGDGANAPSVLRTAMESLSLFER